MTLLGLQKFNLVKGNISVLYKGRDSDSQTQGDVLVVDHKLTTVTSIFNKNQDAKINRELNEIITGKQILKKIQTEQVDSEIETDRARRPINKSVNGFNCTKYVLKSKYTHVKYQMNLSQLDQVKGVKNFGEYLSTFRLDYLPVIAN